MYWSNLYILRKTDLSILPDMWKVIHNVSSFIFMSISIPKSSTVINDITLDYYYITNMQSFGNIYIHLYLITIDQNGDVNSFAGAITYTTNY